MFFTLCYLAGKADHFSAKSNLAFFAGQSSSGGFICFYSECLNRDSNVGFKRKKFWPCYLWQVCICRGNWAVLPSAL